MGSCDGQAEERLHPVQLRATVVCWEECGRDGDDMHCGYRIPEFRVRDAAVGAVGDQRRLSEEATATESWDEEENAVVVSAEEGADMSPHWVLI